MYCRRLVALAHDLGLRVMVWTVDDETEIAGLLDEGVDGVITDRPDVLREVLIARDAWIPPIPVVEVVHPEAGPAGVGGAGIAA